MFLTIFPSLKEKKFFRFINKVLSSPFHIGIVALLLTISSMGDFGLLFYYILLGLCVVIPALIGEDMTAIIPLAVMLNIGISKSLKATNEQILMGPNIVHFVIFLISLIIFMFGRLIIELIFNKERRKRFPRFFIGYICLLFAFCMGGAFSSTYSFETFGFGFREFLALGGFYFYYFYTVDSDKLRKSYFAYVLFFMAASVALQILVEAVQTDVKTWLETGWANRSGLGGTLVAAFTGTVYLIIKRQGQWSWLYTICYFFFLTMICLTQCRGAALTAFIISIPCFILIMIFGDQVTKITTILLTIAYAVMMVLWAVLEKEFFKACFGRIFNFDFDSFDEFSSGRITIWKTGIDQFIHNPLCGVGWYQIPDLGFPARYHNTGIQILAATGLFGAVCYLYHRAETIYVTFKKPTLEKSFAFIAIACILISSMLDCYLFNIWLGFEYAFLLSYIEGRNLAYKKEIVTKPTITVYQTRVGNSTIVIMNK